MVEAEADATFSLAELELLVPADLVLVAPLLVVFVSPVDVALNEQVPVPVFVFVLESHVFMLIEASVSSERFSSLPSKFGCAKGVPVGGESGLCVVGDPWPGALNVPASDADECSPSFEGFRFSTNSSTFTPDLWYSSVAIFETFLGLSTFHTVIVWSYKQNIFTFVQNSISS